MIPPASQENERENLSAFPTSQSLHQDADKKLFTRIIAGFSIFIVLFSIVELIVLQNQLSDTNKKIVRLLSHLSEFEDITSQKVTGLSLSFESLQGLVLDEKSNALAKYQTIEANMTLLHHELSKTSYEMSSITTKLNSHEDTLIKLTNRTTNAEVLDRLQSTQEKVMNELLGTKLEVSSILDEASKNVTDQLNKSHKRLDNTVIMMQGVITEAENNIYQVQANVTDQLSEIAMYLNHTVSDLNLAVSLAQATIHSEVDIVKDKIEEYVLATNVKFAAENDFVKYQLAGTFTLIGCLISLWHMTSHWRHYEKPDVQRRIMAVLWMVPIYGITSWLSLVFESLEVVFSAIRDCYEAYAVYTFIALLIAVLEDEKGLPELLRLLTKHVIEERREIQESTHKSPSEHLKPPFPCCYIHHKPSSVAAAWLYQCKFMAMQFVILKPLLTAIPVIIEFFGVDYHGQSLIRHGSLNWNAARLYVIFLQNISVAVAFYGLLSFYHGTEKDLAWCNPWPKFLCIKGVVFMTFWQGVSLQVMSMLGWVDYRVSAQIQNLLICIEMLLASIAHFYIFPYQEWQEGYKRNREKTIAIRDTLALKDFYKDIRQMVTTWEPPSTEGTHNSITGSPIAKLSMQQEVDDIIEEELRENDCDSNIYNDIEMNYLHNGNINITNSNPLFPSYYQLNSEEIEQGNTIKRNDVIRDAKSSNSVFTMDGNLEVKNNDYSTITPANGEMLVSGNEDVSELRNFKV